MPRLLPALAAGLLMLIAGCAALPDPLATPVPPDGLHPNPPPVAQPTATPTPPPEQLDELGRQRAIWQKAGLANYRLRLIYGCQCELGGETVEVTVRRGRIASAEIDGKPIDLDRLHGVPATIDELFDYAERNAGAGKEELKYDRALGYPLALGIDPDLEARDDEIRVAILELAPGR